MTDEQKVRAGEELAIRADTWNDVMDMLREFKRNRATVGVTAPFAYPAHPVLTVLVVNQTGDPIYEPYAVVRINEIAVPLTKSNQYSYSRRPVVNGYVPESADDDIAILTAPVGTGPGSIGSGAAPSSAVMGVVSGVCLAHVLMNDDADRWANPVPGVTTYLESHPDAGQVQILDVVESLEEGSNGSIGSGDSGPGFKLALVNLTGKKSTGGSGGGTDITVNEVNANPSTITKTFTTDTLKFDTYYGFDLQTSTGGIPWIKLREALAPNWGVVSNLNQLWSGAKYANPGVGYQESLASPATRVLVGQNNWNGSNISIYRGMGNILLNSDATGIFLDSPNRRVFITSNEGWTGAGSNFPVRYAIRQVGGGVAGAILDGVTGTLLSGATVTGGIITNLGTGSGGGGGTGTVTSVALAMPGEFTVTGSPITDAGVLTATYILQAANRVFAGPSAGGATVPGFRALVDADIPNDILIDGGSF